MASDFERQAAKIVKGVEKDLNKNLAAVQKSHAGKSPAARRAAGAKAFTKAGIDNPDKKTIDKIAKDIADS